MKKYFQANTRLEGQAGCNALSLGSSGAPVAATKSTKLIFVLPHIPQFLISWLQMLLKVEKKKAQNSYGKLEQ